MWKHLSLVYNKQMLSNRVPLQHLSAGQRGYAGGFWGAADWAPQPWDGVSWSGSAAGAAPPGWTPRDSPTACDAQSTCERVNEELSCWCILYTFLLTKKTYLFTEKPWRNSYTHLNNPTRELPGITTACHRSPLSSSTGAVGGSVFCLRALCRAGNYFV